MAYRGCSRPMPPFELVAPVVHTLARKPHYAAVFPIAAGLADWATWAA